MGGCKGARGVGGLYKKYQQALVNITQELAQFPYSLLVRQDIEIIKELIEMYRKQCEESLKNDTI